jgi:hypothetical protein
MEMGTQGVYRGDEGASSLGDTELSGFLALIVI